MPLPLATGLIEDLGTAAIGFYRQIETLAEVNSVIKWEKSDRKFYKLIILTRTMQMILNMPKSSDKLVSDVTMRS